MQTRSHIVKEQRSVKGPFASGRLQKSGSCCQMWWKAPLDLQHGQTSLCTTMGWRNKATSLQNRSVLMRTIWCWSFWIICFSSTVICWVGCKLLALHLCTPWIFLWISSCLCCSSCLGPPWGASGPECADCTLLLRVDSSSFWHQYRGGHQAAGICQSQNGWNKEKQAKTPPGHQDVGLLEW